MQVGARVIGLVVRQPDGDGDLQVMIEVQDTDGGAQPVGDELALGQRESVEDDDELLTAVAPIPS